MIDIRKKIGNSCVYANGFKLSVLYFCARKTSEFDILINSAKFAFMAPKKWFKLFKSTCIYF